MQTNSYNRRIIILMMAVLIALTFSGCKDLNKNVAETSEGMETKETIKTTETRETAESAKTTETTKNTEKTYDFSEGTEAMDFEVELLTGEKVKLSDYRGKVVLLNFWATWCGYCVKELPELQRLREDYGEELVVFTINCGEDKKKAEDFIKKNNYTFTVGLDPKNEVGYPVRTIPITFVIDKDGIISDKLVGYKNNAYEYFKAEIEKANK